MVREGAQKFTRWQGNAKGGVRQGKLPCRRMRDDNRSTAGFVYARNQFFSPVERISWWRQHEDRGPLLPFQREKILQVSPLLQVLGNAVPRQLLMKFCSAVACTSKARTGADYPDGIYITELAGQFCCHRLAFPGDLSNGRDSSFAIVQNPGGLFLGHRATCNSRSLRPTKYSAYMLARNSTMFRKIPRGTASISCSSSSTRRSIRTSAAEASGPASEPVMPTVSTFFVARQTDSLASTGGAAGI